MGTPFFSIVIPTRNRPRTLFHTLKTCLSQTYEHFEIVISDNSTNDDTFKMVSQFIALSASTRIRYVRTPRSLSMSGNFDYALSHATGDYVILIGDDDGLLPYSLAGLSECIAETGCRAIRWDLIWYFWPDFALPDKRNRVSIPFGATPQMLDGEAVIQDVLHYERYYATLPMLYHSAIARSLLEELKAQTGKICQSRSPDLYTGIALAYLAQSFYYAGPSYSIIGISGNSTGWAHLLNNQVLLEDFDTTNTADGIDWHPQVPRLPSMVCYIADSFQFAQEALFPQRADLACDPKTFAVNVVATLAEFADPTQCLQELRRVYAGDAPMLQWIDTILAPNFSNIRQEMAAAEPDPYASKKVYNLDAYERYQISDVYALSQAMANLTSLQQGAASQPEPTPCQF
jgi:hypothetical protein